MWEREFKWSSWFKVCHPRQWRNGEERASGRTLLQDTATACNCAAPVPHWKSPFGTPLVSIVFLQSPLYKCLFSCSVFVSLLPLSSPLITVQELPDCIVMLLSFLLVSFCFWVFFKSQNRLLGSTFSYYSTSISCWLYYCSIKLMIFSSL